MDTQYCVIGFKLVHNIIYPARDCQEIDKYDSNLSKRMTESNMRLNLNIAISVQIFTDLYRTVSAKILNQKPL